MTYKELFEELRTASEEKLAQAVTVHLMDSDEHYPVQAVCVAVEGECALLGAGHLVLAAGL